MASQKFRIKHGPKFQKLHFHQWARDEEGGFKAVEFQTTDGKRWAVVIRAYEQMNEHSSDLWNFIGKSFNETVVIRGYSISRGGGTIEYAEGKLPSITQLEPIVKPDKVSYSFDEACSRLELTAHTFDLLIAEGEIRSFREGGKTKFWKSEIDELTHEKLSKLLERLAPPAIVYSSEFYAFGEAMLVLGINENWLRKQVCEGEIRAFREDDQMKFKQKEIDVRAPWCSFEKAKELLPADDLKLRNLMQVYGDDLHYTLRGEVRFRRDKVDELHKNPSFWK